MSVQKIFRNLFSNYAAFAVTGLSSFVLTPILFHHLEAINYAILTFALATLGIGQLLDLGFFSSLVHFVSNLVERQERVELRRLVSTAFYVALGLGSMGSLTILAGSRFLASFFHLQGAASEPVILVLSVVGLSLPFLLASNTLLAYLWGCQDFHLANGAEIAVVLLETGATVLLLWAGYGLLAVSVIYAAGALAWLLALLLIARRAAVPFTPSPWDVNLSSLRRVWRFAWAAFVDNNARLWFMQLDVLLCTRFLPLPQVAILAIARRFPMALTALCARGVAIGQPILSSANARNDRGPLEKFILVVTRDLLAVLLPVGIALFTWADVILRLWVGKEVVSGTVALQALVIFALFGGLYGVPSAALYGLGRINFTAVLSLLMLIGGTALGAWVCQWGGLLGLALGYSFVQMVGTVLLFGQVLPLAQVRVGLLWKKVVLPVLPALLVTGVWFALSYRMAPHTWAGMIISMVSGCLLFFAVFIAGGDARENTLYGRARRLLFQID